MIRSSLRTLVARAVFWLVDALDWWPAVPSLPARVTTYRTPPVAPASGNVGAACDVCGTRPARAAIVWCGHGLALETCLQCVPCVVRDGRARA